MVQERNPKTQWLVWRRSLMKLGPVLTWEGQSFTWRTHSLNGETHGSWKDTNLGMLNGIPTLRIFPFGGVPLEWHSGLSWPSLTLTGEDSFILLVVREKKKLSESALLSFWDLSACRNFSLSANPPHGRLYGMRVKTKVLDWPVGGSFCLMKDLIILLGIKSKPHSPAASS